MTATNQKSFLKWLGSKHKLFDQLSERLPSDFTSRRYVEPFVGGGSFFFGLAPERAMLSDVNDRLIKTFRAVKTDVEEVIKYLHEFKDEHSEELYYETRSHFNEEKLDGAIFAAAFIYLNKTCFNGVYRENSSGQFNVPSGKRSHLSIDVDTLRNASALLKNTILTCCSYEEACLFVDQNDFVYFDPPYAPISETSNFKAYHSSGWSWLDQQQLHETFCSLDERGCKVMLSNSATPELQYMYRKFNVEIVQANRSVGARHGSAVTANELIVRNYK